MALLGHLVRGDTQTITYIATQPSTFLFVAGWAYVARDVGLSLRDGHDEGDGVAVLRTRRLVTIPIHLMDGWMCKQQ